MRSIKISEDANKNITDLSQIFYMTKQALVSLVLENIRKDNVYKLLGRKINEDGYEVEGYEEYKKDFREMTQEELEEEFNDDEEDTIEFEPVDEVDEEEIKGL